MDVNDTFLQGKLTEEVYMKQPLGFIHPDHPNHICKLRKAIYGLRQAPRAWYDSLTKFIISFGFCNSLSDPSLFIHNNNGVVAYFLVYVDDLLLTGNSVPFLKKFITSLSMAFSLKHMGF